MLQTAVKHACSHEARTGVTARMFIAYDCTMRAQFNLPAGQSRADITSSRSISEALYDNTISQYR